MNRAITLASKGDAFEILVGPEVAYSEQRKNFRVLRRQLTGYDKLELWCSSSGRVKQYKFKSKVAASSAPETDTNSEAENGAPAQTSTPEGALNDTGADKPLTKKEQAKADAAKRRAEKPATKKTAKAGKK